MTVFFTAWMEMEDLQSEDACAVVSRALLLRIDIFFGEKSSIAVVYSNLQEFRVSDLLGLQRFCEIFNGQMFPCVSSSRYFLLLKFRRQTAKNAKEQEKMRVP